MDRNAKSFERSTTPRTSPMKMKSPPITLLLNSSVICFRERWFEEKETAVYCLAPEAVARPE
jgi:hypothetical protein